MKLPIIGFDTETTKEVNEILKKEGIKLRDFIIKEIPELTSEGTTRELFVEIRDLKINDIETSYLLSFSLPKGSYATEVIRQMFS